MKWLFAGFLVLYFLHGLEMERTFSKIAADIAVIRSTYAQQPLPVKGEAPTSPNGNVR